MYNSGCKFSPKRRISPRSAASLYLLWCPAFRGSFTLYTLMMSKVHAPALIAGFWKNAKLFFA